MINQDRIQVLNDTEKKRGKYILYWMQAAQREEYNHALEYAVRLSNTNRIPLLTVFCLVDDYPQANNSHYRFLLEGLQEVDHALESRKIPFFVIEGNPIHIIPSLAEDAALVVVDRDYQRMQQEWRASVAKSIECSLHQVETNVIIPIQTVSGKEEYTAGTIRPKIHRILSEYLVSLRRQSVKIPSIDIDMDSVSLDDINTVLKRKDGRSQEQKIEFKGGTSSAKKLLRKFIRQDLDAFDTKRNDPAIDRLSNMSPYLHFGQISPLYIALEVMKVGSPSASSYLEELIVRRELSMNFVFYNKNYDNFECLPNWAKETLELHSFDKREYTYSYRELEDAETHDPYWNAAQKEMTQIGKMHGYMRMYWGKKILEWSDSPIDAYETCVRLNDTYELDGRDPNGYTGVAWCFGKHDRAWGEREIFGKVRYMNDRGLKRKFDIEAYVQRINQL